MSPSLRTPPEPLAGGPSAMNPEGHLREFVGALLLCPRQDSNLRYPLEEFSRSGDVTCGDAGHRVSEQGKDSSVVLTCSRCFPSSCVLNTCRWMLSGEGHGLLGGRRAAGVRCRCPVRPSRLARSGPRGVDSCRRCQPRMSDARLWHFDAVQQDPGGGTRERHFSARLPGGDDEASVAALAPVLSGGTHVVRDRTFPPSGMPGPVRAASAHAAEGRRNRWAGASGAAPSPA